MQAYLLGDERGRNTVGASRCFKPLQVLLLIEDGFVFLLEALVGADVDELVDGVGLQAVARLGLCHGLQLVVALRRRLGRKQRKKDGLHDLEIRVAGGKHLRPSVPGHSTRCTFRGVSPEQTVAVQERRQSHHCICLPDGVIGEDFGADVVEAGHALWNGRLVVIQELGIAHVTSVVNGLQQIQLTHLIPIDALLPHRPTLVAYFPFHHLLHPRLHICGTRDHLRNVRRIGIGYAKENEGGIKELGNLGTKRSKGHVGEHGTDSVRLLANFATLHP